MARYIDVDAFLEKMKQTPRYFDVKFDVENFSTADVVEVVRCGKCKHWREKGYDPIFERKFGYCYNHDFPFQCEERPMVDEIDFCSYGEPKDIPTKIEHNSLCETETYLKE